MASIKAKKAAATASQPTADKGNQTVEVSYPRKVNFENNPSLVGFFSVVTEGYPVFGKVSLTEREENKFNILFPNKKYKDKAGETQYQNFIHPISKDVRQNLLNTTVKAFEDLSEDHFEEVEKDKIEEVLKTTPTIIRFPEMKDIPTFKALVGNASFVTREKMALKDVELHISKDENYYLNFQSEPYDNDKGERKFAPCCGTFNSEASKAIVEAAVEAFKAEGLID